MADAIDLLDKYIDRVDEAKKAQKGFKTVGLGEAILSRLESKIDLLRWMKHPGIKKPTKEHMTEALKGYIEAYRGKAGYPAEVMTAIWKRISGIVTEGWEHMPIKVQSEINDALTHFAKGGFKQLKTLRRIFPSAALGRGGLHDALTQAFMERKEKDYSIFERGRFQRMDMLRGKSKFVQLSTYLEPGFEKQEEDITKYSRQIAEWTSAFKETDPKTRKGIADLWRKKAETLKSPEEMGSKEWIDRFVGYLEKKEIVTDIPKDLIKEGLEIIIPKITDKKIRKEFLEMIKRREGEIKQKISVVEKPLKEINEIIEEGFKKYLVNLPGEVFEKIEGLLKVDASSRKERDEGVESAIRQLYAAVKSGGGINT